MLELIDSANPGRKRYVTKVVIAVLLHVHSQGQQIIVKTSLQGIIWMDLWAEQE